MWQANLAQLSVYHIDLLYACALGMLISITEADVKTSINMYLLFQTSNASFSVVLWYTTFT